MHGTMRRDPSTQPHAPIRFARDARLSVGMTGVNIMNIHEITVDIK